MRNKVPEYCSFYHNDVTEDHSLIYRGVEETRRLTGEAMVHRRMNPGSKLGQEDQPINTRIE
jgi:hypothetical protein